MIDCGGDIDNDCLEGDRTLIMPKIGLEIRYDNRPSRVYVSPVSISPPYSRHCCRLTNVDGRGPRLSSYILYNKRRRVG